MAEACPGVPGAPGVLMLPGRVRFRLRFLPAATAWLAATVVSARAVALPSRSVRRLMRPQVVGTPVMEYPQSRYHPRHQHRPVRRCQ